MPRDGGLKERIRRAGIEVGFDVVGFAPPVLPEEGRHLTQWLRSGYQAGMDYMDRHREVCMDPQAFYPGVKTVIAVAQNYHRPEPARPAGAPKISSYARGRDYHKVLKRRLATFLERIREMSPGTRGRAAVDTSPVLDKLWAAAAGLGWQGKHTNLITRSHGSWVFLGTLWIDLEIPPDLPSPDFCGSCRRCLDACPTGAFPQPYVLDSRRCITYWNVEHRGDFFEDTPPLHGWLFGCDICQDVCPWNKFQREAPGADFTPRAGLLRLTTRDWAALDGEAYDEATRGTAMRRARREGLRRNAARLLEENRVRTGGAEAKKAEESTGGEVTED